MHACNYLKNNSSLHWAVRAYQLFELHNCGSHQCCCPSLQQMRQIKKKNTLTLWYRLKNTYFPLQMDALYFAASWFHLNIIIRRGPTALCSYSLIRSVVHNNRTLCEHLSTYIYNYKKNIFECKIAKMVSHKNENKHRRAPCGKNTRARACVKNENYLRKCGDDR